MKVKLYATLRRFAPENVELGQAFTIEIDDSTIDGVLKKLGIDANQAKIIMVNGIRKTNLEYELSSSDTVVIFPPVGGG